MRKLKTNHKHLLNEAGFLVLLFGLGLLSFGWIVWPELGIVTTFVHGGIIAVILLAGLSLSIYRRIKAKIQG